VNTGRMALKTISTELRRRGARADDANADPTI
jgi:hypothetical protein